MMYKKPIFQIRGFSLIELMVAIAIIGVLATIVIGSTSGSRAKSRDNRRITDIKVIQLGLALYYDVNKAYPVGANISSLTVPIVNDKYLPEIPADPQGGTYEYKSDGMTYCLGTLLESTTIPAENAASLCTSADSGSTANYKVKR